VKIEQVVWRHAIIPVVIVSRSILVANKKILKRGLGDVKISDDGSTSSVDRSLLY
jgi:hypothetical protein